MKAQKGSPAQESEATDENEKQEKDCEVEMESSADS